VIPRAGTNALGGQRGGALVVRLRAAPVENAANDALLALLAERLLVPRRRIRIIRGSHSRTKRVFVEGATVPGVQAVLAPHS
jgi:uncharacterized protein YggU (UPF0235/DUF167 family)